MIDSQLLERFKRFQKKTGKYLDFELDTVEFEGVSFDDNNIFTFVKGLNKYVRAYIDNNAGKIPVMGSSLDNNCISSYIKPIAEKDVIREDCVSFNKDNAKGSRAFFRNFPFVMDRHHLAIIPKGEKVNVKYLYHFLDYFLQTKYYGWGTNVASVDEIKNYSMPIPKPFNDIYTSVKIQEILVEFVECYQKETNRRLGVLNNISNKITEAESLVLPLFFSKHPSVIKRFDAFCRMKKFDLTLEELIFEYNAYDKVFDTVSPTIKIKDNETLNKGTYPVVSQSFDKINGYTNLQTGYIDAEENPVIIFGDHTAILKFINFKFFAGADGTKIFKSKNENISTKYLYYLSMNKVKSQGYERHFKYFRDLKFLLPLPINNFTSLQLQQIIIDFIESYFKKMNHKRRSADGFRRLFTEYIQIIIEKTFKTEETI